MTLKRSTLTVMAAVSAAALLLASCGSGQGSYADDGECRLVYLASADRPTAEQDTYRQVMQQFGEGYGCAVEVKFEGTWDEIVQQVTSARIAEEQLDIISTSTSTRDLADAGMLTDLTQCVAGFSDAASRTPRSRPTTTATSQLATMARVGLSGLQIQARLSLPIEQYLDDQYLRAVRQTVDCAAGLGLEVGFYDEHAWQSGSAAGRVTDGAPELAESLVFWAEPRVDEGRLCVELDAIETSSADLGEAGLVWHLRNGVLEWGRVRLLGVLMPDGDLVECDVCALEASSGDGLRAVFDLDEAGASVAEAARSGGLAVIVATATSSRVINYLLPEAVERFVEVNHDRYLAAFDGAVPHNLTHVFYDQPHSNCYAWHDASGHRQTAHPYSDALWADLGTPDTPTRAEMVGVVTGLVDDPEVRERWYRYYTDFATTTFFGLLRLWCDQQGSCSAAMRCWATSAGGGSITPSGTGTCWASSGWTTSRWAGGVR